jgi:hypothetical protein
MPGLSQQRCFQHSLREAVARCPECRRFYCRECVTEHDDRLLCAACIKKLANVPLTQRNLFVHALRIVQVAFGLFVTIAFFYTVGRQLLAIPSTFHDGSVWRTIDAADR